MVFAYNQETVPQATKIIYQKKKNTYVCNVKSLQFYFSQMHEEKARLGC